MSFKSLKYNKPICTHKIQSDQYRFRITKKHKIKLVGSIIIAFNICNVMCG